MNTLDDLRTTLRAHTATGDAALLDRATSVRSRVKVVRRHRRLAAAAGAVAAVALVVAGIALPRLTTDRGEADLAAAAGVTWNGFEYSLVEEYPGKAGQDRLDLDLPRSDRGQVAVLLAEHLDGGSATLLAGSVEEPDGERSDGEEVDRLVEDGAGDPVTVADFPDGVRPTMPYAVRVDGGSRRTRVGVAVYRRTDAMPKGVADPTGSTVFRQQVGARTLLAGAFAEPGRAESTIRFTSALSEVRIAEFCSAPGGESAKSGPWVNVSIDGHRFLSGTCGPAAEDASPGASYSPDSHEVAEHTAQVWISPTNGGARTPVPGAVVGIAVYGPAETVQVHGSTIDRVIEFDGRRWQLERVVDSEAGAHQIEATWIDLRDHLLVGYAVEGTRLVRTGGSVHGTGFRDGSSTSLADARHWSIVGEVLPGSDATFTVTWPATYSGASGAILVYRPLG